MKAMKAAQVYYDPEQNTYYKIDKQTGHTIKVHCNGAEFFSFKPDCSGFDYRIRKSFEELTPPLLLKPVFRPKHHKKCKSIKDETRRHTKSQAFLARVPFLEKSTNVGSFESKFSDAKRMFNTEYNQKLRQYSQMKEDLRLENHSPRHGYEGSLITANISAQYKNDLTASLSIFSNSCRKLRKINFNHTINSSSMKEQFQKQREVFLRFNSKFRQRDNPRQEREQRQRKVNLQILETLALEKNNKETSWIYE